MSFFLLLMLLLLLLQTPQINQPTEIVKITEMATNRKIVKSSIGGG